MYMAKAIAAFVMSIVTGLTASDVMPITGTVHLVLTIVAVIATAVITYAIPNRASVVLPNVVP